MVPDYPKSAVISKVDGYDFTHACDGPRIMRLSFKLPLVDTGCYACSTLCTKSSTGGCRGNFTTPVNLHNAKYARLFQLWLLSNYDTEKTVAPCIKRNTCFNCSLHYVHKSRLDGEFLYVSLSILY